MKRDDLHKYRRTRSAQSPSTSFNSAAGTSYKLLPLCHFVQFGFASLLLLCILIYQSLMKPQEIQPFCEHLQKHIAVNLTLPSGEWSGSLKDIFLTTK